MVLYWIPSHCCRRHGVVGFWLCAAGSALGCSVGFLELRPRRWCGSRLRRVRVREELRVSCLHLGERPWYRMWWYLLPAFPPRVVAALEACLLGTLGLAFVGFLPMEIGAWGFRMLEASLVLRSVGLWGVQGKISEVEKDSGPLTCGIAEWENWKPPVASWSEEVAYYFQHQFLC